MPCVLPGCRRSYSMQPPRLVLPSGSAEAAFLLLFMHPNRPEKGVRVWNWAEQSRNTRHDDFGKKASLPRFCFCSIAVPCAVSRDFHTRWENARRRA